MPAFLLFAALIAFTFYLVSLYNRLLGLQFQAKQHWDATQARLQQQQDLLLHILPHAGEQRETLIALRASLDEANRIGNVGRIRELQSAWLQLGMLNEQPDSPTPPALRQQLQDTQTELLTQAAAYDEAAARYNLCLARFPGNLLAGLFGLSYCPTLHLGKPH